MEKTYIQIKYPKIYDTNISKMEESSISLNLNHFSYEGELNRILKEKNNKKKKIIEFENMRKIEYEKIQIENSIYNSFKCSNSLSKENKQMTLNNENDKINDEENKIIYRANTLQNIIKIVKKKQNFFIKKPQKIKIKNTFKRRLKNKSIKKQILNNNKSLKQEKTIDKEKIENFIKKLRERIKNREEEEKKKKMEKEKNELIKNENIKENLIKIEINIKRIIKEEKEKKIEREKLLKLKKEKLEEEERKKKEIEEEKVQKYLNQLKIVVKNRIEEEKKKSIEKENEEKMKKKRLQNILDKIELNRKKQFNEEEDEEKKKEEEERKKIKIEERKLQLEEIEKKREERMKIRLERRLKEKERIKKKEEERKLKEEERFKKIEEEVKKQIEKEKKETEKLLELEKKIQERKEKEEERIIKEKEEIKLKQSFIKLERERRFKEEEENKRIKEIEKIQLLIDTLRNKIEIKNEEKLNYENLNEELKHEWRLEKINNLLNEFIILNDNENMEQKLEIINEVGKYFKEEIKYDKENNKNNNIITINDALINNDSLINFIGILAEEFKNYGINSIIEKETSDLNLVENVFQLLLSKLSKEMKFEIKIKNIKLINQFKNDISKYFQYLQHLKYTIIDIFNVNKKDIYLINNDIENFEIILVILNRRDIELYNLYRNDIIIRKKNLLESVKFYLDFFDNKYNRLENNWERENFKRGGEKYNPPYFYKGFALRVLNKFDNGNNSWLDNNGNENEWAIGYHGIGKGNEFNKLLNIIKENLKSGPGQLFEYLPNIRDKNNSQIGIGVYLANDINEAEKYSDVVIVGQKRVKFIVMCRVNPKKIRETGNYPINWIVDDNYDSLRPYRILVKEIKWFS